MFFRSLAVLAVLAANPSLNAEAPGPERRVRMYHTHTGERIDIVYRQGERYISEALDRLNYFLRDHRTNDIHAYDPRVFDIVTDLLGAVSHPNAEVQIVCGYRTPWSNQFLRTHTSGVAQNSLHMQAEAIDIRLPGVSVLALRDAALKLARGGVGYYPKSGFIHVDVGRVRRW